MRDLSPLEIKMLLMREGYPSFRVVDIKHKLKTNTASNASRFPLKSGEAVIAKIIGIKAKDIWPTRYKANGQRRKSLPLTQYRGSSVARHCQKEVA